CSAPSITPSPQSVQLPSSKPLQSGLQARLPPSKPWVRQVSPSSAPPSQTSAPEMTPSPHSEQLSLSIMHSSVHDSDPDANGSPLVESKSPQVLSAKSAPSHCSWPCWVA